MREVVQQALFLLQAIPEVSAHELNRA